MTYTDLLSNPWTISIFGGATATIIGTYFFIFKNNKESISIENYNPQSQTNNNRQTQSVTVNNLLTTPIVLPVKEIASSEVILLKQDLRILFIDNLDLKKKIENLKDAGWINVSQINDAPNVDIQQIREADIIFVDYKGIGKIHSTEEGLGVLSALRQRYGEDKYLILYTAHNLPVEAFTRKADNYVDKNSKIFELEHKIIEGAKKIRK